MLPQTWYGANLAVHLIDLDRFKSINEVFGLGRGDAVLKIVADRLRALVGKDDVVARLSADEFAVLQSGPRTVDAAAELADRIVRSLAAPVVLGDTTVVVGASVGIAYGPRDGTTSNDLIRNADLALHNCKAEGRGTHRFYDEALSERALARRLLEIKLRLALQAEEFGLHYQPIVEAADLRVVGYEALLRWQDQTGQAISPAEFVPLAEELGLMPALGAWVLRTACEEARNWCDTLTVSVNVSAEQLRDHAFVRTVRDILAETGFEPSRLELEVTETAVLRDWDLASRILAELRALGIRVALDDFGTGFSSLSMVERLPLTRIKIDRSFVSGIDATAKSMSVLRAILTLCRGYGLATTAEGVETIEQLEALRAEGCESLQGYALGRPAPASHWFGEPAAPAPSHPREARTSPPRRRGAGNEPRAVAGDQKR